MATADTSLLGTFQKHIEDMRSLSLCKICIKPFYEPFILSCGHTYCYSCLASWFSGPHTRNSSKNCPDCRAPVTIQPSPNYLLRDLVHMFISRTELLPEDETVQEHTEAKEQESRLLAADRSGQGLFKGVFDRHRHYLPNRPNVTARPRDPVAPIRDAEDGVSRCPRCVWELEYGECPQCGWNEDFGSDSGTSASLETQSLADLPPEDGSEAWARAIERMEENTTLYDEMSDDGGDITEGYSESTEGRDSPPYSYASEDDDEMEGFIDDDDLPNEVDDDDRSVNTVTMYPTRSRFDSGEGEGENIDQDTSQPATQRFYGVTMEESGSSDDSGSSDEETNTQTSTHEDDTDDMASEQATNYDSDDDSVQEDPQPPLAVARSNRRRRIVDSDDDEEDDEEQEGQQEGQEDNDNDPGESDDSASQPPQNSAFRRQRLQSQRARRSNNQPQHQGRSESPYEDFPTLSQQPGRGYGRERAPSATGFHPARRGRPQSTRVY